MSDVKQILKEYNEVQSKYHELSDKLEKIHDDNIKLADEMLPKIKKAIIKHIFKKGNCFSGRWTYLHYADKAMGEHYQLNSLGEIRKLKKKESFPPPVFREEDLDTKYIQDRILNRYFGYYEPNHELLWKELKIKI